MKTKMPELKKNPTLKELQEYMKELVASMGWDKETSSEKFVLFIEEVGELAKAIRNHLKLYDEEEGKKLELEHEFADVLNYLLDLANDFDVDLEKAFREKDKINKKRTWT